LAAARFSQTGADPLGEIDGVVLDAQIDRRLRTMVDLAA
jgi:hypothetical protein